MVSKWQTFQDIGITYLPIQLKGRVRVLQVLVQELEWISGLIWASVKILTPENGSFCPMNAIWFQCRGYMAPNQRSRLEEVINQAFAKMGHKLGCRNLVEHFIYT